MSTFLLILLVGVIWLVASIPLGLFVGAFLRRNNGDREQVIDIRGGATWDK